MFQPKPIVAAATGCAMLCLLMTTGCARIADTDFIVIAEQDGKPIYRRDLSKHLREMDDDERPIVSSKGDLLRVLNSYIDNRIKWDLAKKLEEEGKIQRHRAQAEAIYFSKYPEDRRIGMIVDPEKAGFSQVEYNALKAKVEFGVDEEEERLLREQALVYAAREAAQNGTLTITEEEFQDEYEFLEGQLMRNEYIEFTAIRFTDMATAAEEAKLVLERVQGGEDFTAIVEEYRQHDPESIFASAFENNPHQQKFRPFWEQVSGANVGDIVGPVVLPNSEAVVQGEDGSEQVIQVPASLLVLKVEVRREAAPMTLAEAKPVLQPQILLSKMMARLRDERDVKIFEENLPNPGGYGNQFKDPVAVTFE